MTKTRQSERELKRRAEVPLRRMVHVPALKAKCAIIREDFPRWLPIDERDEFEGFEAEARFALFFGVQPTTFSNYLREESVPRMLERAIALRYGFGPTDAFGHENRGLETPHLWERWLNTDLSSWRSADAEKFGDALRSRLLTQDVAVRLKPMSRDNSDLLRAITIVKADIGRRSRRADPGAAAGISKPSNASIDWLPETKNFREGLVSVSAGFTRTNNPEDGKHLLVNFNTNPEEFEHRRRRYTYRLTSGRLKLLGTVFMHNPLGWNYGRKHAVSLGEAPVLVNFLGAPPGQLLWQLNNLDAHEGGSSFSEESFGVISTPISSTLTLELQVSLADVEVNVSSIDDKAKPSTMSVDKRKMWENLLARAAIALPDAGSHIALCRQTLRDEDEL